MRGLAYRRAQRQRFRNRFRKAVACCWGSGLTPERREHLVRKFAETRKPCSCEGCGNQRRYVGAPIRERRLWPDNIIHDES